MGNPSPTLDYATPAKDPGRARLKKWLKRLSLALLILASLYTAPLAWLYVGWKQEQPAHQMVARVGGRILATKPAGPAFLERLIPARLGWIRERVTGVGLSETPASDDDLGTLRRLGLNGLSLTCTPVTDAGLVHLKGLAGLQKLSLAGTQVTERGLVHLQGLTGLQELYLGGIPVTDAGLVQLKGLTQLQRLALYGTRVTDAGVAELQKALPGCKVYR